MPWGKEDARRHTKKAKSDVRKRQFAHVANSMLERGASEGSAIVAANSAVKKSVRKHGQRKAPQRKRGRK
jgi:uncharacterized protein YdaT